MTQLADVQDREVWNHMLTPQVKALIGSVSRYGEPQLFETVAGQFPGDEASNLNQHRLYAGSGDYVRFPYLSTLHKTEYGAFVIKRDGVKVKAMCWVGDVFKGNAELVYVAALRDRRFDGTRRANDSALLFYPYDDAKFHKPLSKELRSVEVSLYSFNTGSRISSAYGEREFEHFVAAPFHFMKRPELFLHYFHKAWLTDRAPGQVAAPIQDVSRKSLPGLELIARRHGYDLLECATSHYHVARWFQSRQYRYSFIEDERTMSELSAGIERTRALLKQRGQELRRTQESWIAVVQSLRPVELIPDGLYLNGPLWPQDNIKAQNLWMNKALTEKAARLITGPMVFENTT
jgi:hypothetical protein